LVGADPAEHPLGELVSDCCGTGVVVKLALFTVSLEVGGAERVLVTLANRFAALGTPCRLC